MTTPISACLIVRDDPHLAKTIACLRPHVTEICIAHMPCANMPRGMVESVCDRYVVAPGYEDGRIVDFSAARNASFALATQPYILWADTDDLVDGLQHLPEAIETLNRYPKSRLLCPYEYAYDKDTGEVASLQRRERIIPNNGRFHWVHPYHECLVAKDGQYDTEEPYESRIVWKHQRGDTPVESGRALRILQAHERTNPPSPWLLLNLGLEHGRAQNHERAAEYLEQYVAISGWDDEKALAMIQLCEEHKAIEGFSHGARWQKAQEWASKALELRPDWFEPYWELAKIAWLRASLLGDEDSVGETIEMCRRARLQPWPNHPLVIRPTDRTYAVHELERNAREVTEDWHGALDATERALVHRPNDAPLRMARRRYEAALKLDAADACVAGDAPVVFTETSEDGTRTVIDCAPKIHPVPEAGKRDIIFACGQALEPWNPGVYAERGLGGSETAVIEMSKRLAARGHRVRVYGVGNGSGLYDGVEWREAANLTKDDKPTCDVLVAWRQAPLLGFGDSKVSVLWVHDVLAHGMTPHWSVRAQRVLALTEWHKGVLADGHKLSPDQVHVTRNGIDLSRFAEHVLRDPHKAIYASSADRGLQVLLDVWPRIRAEVPDATLDVFYSMDIWQMLADRDGDQQKRYAVHALKSRLATMGEHGVTFHGGTNQRDLARAMMGAGTLLYPTHWFETSCIVAQEAQAAGLRVVTTAKAALNETVANRGHLIPGDWLDVRYQDAFVAGAIEALTAPDPWRGWTRDALRDEAQARFCWDGVVDDWEMLFADLLAEVDDGVLPPYRGAT